MKISSVPRIMIKELIYGAHLAASISPALVIALQILLDLPIILVNIAIVYLITLIVYSYNYQNELDKDVLTNSDKVKYLLKRKKYFPYLIAGYLLILIVLFILSKDIGFIIFITLLLIGGILYTIIFKVLTRNIPGFKSLFLATFYAYAATFFIVYCYSFKLDLLVLLIFLLVFIKMFIAVIFFDIKDMNADQKDHLKTLPNIMGRNNTLFALSILNVIHLLLVLVCVYLNYFPFFAIGFTALFLYTQYYLTRAFNASQEKILAYSYVMVDGEFVMWVLVLLLSKALYYRLM